MQPHNLLYDHILFLNGYLVSIFLTRINKDENVMFVVTSEKLVRRKDEETLKPFINYCVKCKVHLCIGDCFMKFHTKVDYLH